MTPSFPQAAKAQMDYAYIANGHMASCNTNLGTIASTSNTLAWTLGGAAVLAGAVALATKSGGGEGGGSGGGEEHTDSSESQAMGTDPITNTGAVNRKMNQYARSPNTVPLQTIGEIVQIRQTSQNPLALIQSMIIVRRSFPATA
ncbi:MAG: hypothetical protein IPK68_15255 [Bdellovibrionales bacterium]|nr:hypothetical protein [Bdellovibrionales bacterium]